MYNFFQEGFSLENNNEWKILGEYIKKIRKEKGISAYSIEQNYGFSRNFWSRIENGTHKSAMKPDLLIRIANILDINYIEFYLIVGYIDKDTLNNFYKDFKKT